MYLKTVRRYLRILFVGEADTRAKRNTKKNYYWKSTIFRNHH